jgi:hypothetical protein
MYWIGASRAGYEISNSLAALHKLSPLCIAFKTGGTALFAVHDRRIMRSMKLKQSNPFLKSAADRKRVLRISAQSSSAVDGIRAPFTMGRGLTGPTSKEVFIAHWKRHVAFSDR